MNGRPETTEAGPYYFRYIDRIPNEDILGRLQSQLDETLPILKGISEEKSKRRYAPDKWSVRQLWSHVTDTERIFASRAFWFARGFEQLPLPGFDQDVAAAKANADAIAWSDHLEEFRLVRLSTIALYRHLPAEAWLRRGIASDNPFTVRALAFIAAGHADHHLAILREKYLSA